MSKQRNARRRVSGLGGPDTPTHRTESSGVGNNPSEQTTTSDKAVSTFQFDSSDVVIQQSPAGYVARIERESGRVEYAGPLDYATMLALAEVGE